MIKSPMGHLNGAFWLLLTPKSKWYHDQISLLAARGRIGFEHVENREHEPHRADIDLVIDSKLVITQLGKL